MHLKQLEIHGFKSFADKVTIELTKGITAVVGPNGSGKSNVVDAIRWVLGEQSAKNLRGSKMDEIIFAGSNTKKPLGMAEVSLTFTDVEETLALDYNEITITRRLFRSGESEYLINKTQCRLKDIYELFMDTGIGKEGFSIIGQGKIDEVLSLKAEDRRNLIEESAGIVKYKYRKMQSQKKLEDTEQTLVRINDIVLELKDQIEPLRIQASEAKVYNEWKEELDKLRINLLTKEVEDKNNKQIYYQKELVQIENELTENKTIVHQIEADLSKLHFETQEENEQLELLKQDYYALKSELEKNQHKIEIIEERKENLTDKIQRIEKEIAVLEKKKHELIESIDNYNEQLEKTNAELVNSQLSIEILTSQMNDKIQELDEGTNMLENYQANLLNRIEDSAGISNKIVKTSNELEYKDKENLEIEKNQLEIIEKNIKTQDVLDEIKREQELESKKKESLESELAELENNLAKLSEINTERKKELVNKQFSLQKDTSNLQANQNMEESKEGYHYGVKSVLEKKIPGIVGTIADIIDVPEKLEKAIETVLGSALQNLVAENSHIAEEAINYLKREKKGRATFLPLDTIKAKPSKVNISDPYILGRAIDLIEFAPEYTDVLEFSLARVLVVENLANAIRLNKEKNNTFRMVTLEGDLIAPSGVLTGGSYRKQKVGLISRKRLIKELSNDIEITNKQIIELTKKLNESEQEYENTSIKVNQIKTKIQEKTLKLFEIKSFKQNITEQLASLTSQAETYKKKSEIINQEIETLKKEHLALIKQKENLELDSDSDNKKTRSLKEELQKLTMLQNKSRENLHQEKIRQAALLQEKKSLEERLKDLETTQKSYVADNQEKLDEKEGIKKEIFKIKEEAIELAENNTHKFQQLEQKNKNIETIQNKISGIDSAIELLVKKEKDYKKIEADLNQKKYKNEIELSKIEINLEASKDKLWDDFNITLLQAEEKKSVDFKVGEAKRKIRTLSQKIADLGLVNFTAISEYERVEERLVFLTQQLNDLEKAKGSLEKVISEMDKIMIKKFKSAYDLINKAFNEVFKELFQGGNASLQLTDEKDILNTGIEIIAQPPGKKSQSLSLLSGGERAMTAIALLLGILKIKPSPFCVLDEIDSALDESNVDRFAEFIQRFSRNTQFILVSHRQGTMEVGDVLYGVTVLESGVSQLISVKLSDYDEL